MTPFGFHLKWPAPTSFSLRPSVYSSGPGTLTKEMLGAERRWWHGRVVGIPGALSQSWRCKLRVGKGTSEERWSGKHKPEASTRIPGVTAALLSTAEPFGSLLRPDSAFSLHVEDNVMFPNRPGFKPQPLHVLRHLCPWANDTLVSQEYPHFPVPKRSHRVPDIMVFITRIETCHAPGIDTNS